MAKFRTGKNRWKLDMRYKENREIRSNSNLPLYFLLPVPLALVFFWIFAIYEFNGTYLLVLWWNITFVTTLRSLIDDLEFSALIIYLIVCNFILYIFL